MKEISSTTAINRLKRRLHRLNVQVNTLAGVVQELDDLMKEFSKDLDVYIEACEGEREEGLEDSF